MLKGHIWYRRLNQDWLPEKQASLVLSSPVSTSVFKDICLQFHFPACFLGLGMLIPIMKCHPCLALVLKKTASGSITSGEISPSSASGSSFSSRIEISSRPSWVYISRNNYADAIRFGTRRDHLEPVKHQKDICIDICCLHVLKCCFVLFWGFPAVLRGLSCP